MRKLILSALTISACVTATPAFAERGDMLVKVRGTYSVRAGGDTITAAVGGSNVSAKVGNAIGAEAAITFFLTNAVAFEASFGGSGYDVKDARGRSLATAGLITPTATLLLYPKPSGRVRPYFGGGVTYAKFSSEKPGEILTNQTSQAPVNYSASMKSGVGAVGQVGVDISINDKFYVNIDGKYRIVNSKLTIVQGPNTQTVSQNMKGFVVGAGMGFKF